MYKDLLKNTIFQSGILAALIVVALPELSWAANVGDVLGNVKDQSQGVLPIINVVAYTAGAFLGVSGALKLKGHAEAPANNKLAPAIGQLGAAGALVALPALLGTLRESLGTGGSSTYSEVHF